MWSSVTDQGKACWVIIFKYICFAWKLSGLGGIGECGYSFVWLQGTAASRVKRGQWGVNSTQRHCHLPALKPCSEDTGPPKWTSLKIKKHQIFRNHAPILKKLWAPGRSWTHEHHWGNDNISPEGFSLDFPGWVFGERFIFNKCTYGPSSFFMTRTFYFSKMWPASPKARETRVGGLSLRTLCYKWAPLVSGSLLT